MEKSSGYVTALCKSSLVTYTLYITIFFSSYLESLIAIKKLIRRNSFRFNILSKTVSRYQDSDLNCYLKILNINFEPKIIKTFSFSKSGNQGKF